jgi:lysozyme family protein
MQTAMTTSGPRPAPVSQMDDGQLDDLLRQGLGQVHDWVLAAPVPSRLIEVLRRKRGG